MTAKEFEKKLKQLRNVKTAYRGDYRMDLYSKGEVIACIYGDGDLSKVYADERFDGTVLVYTDTIGLTIDNAEVTSV